MIAALKLELTLLARERGYRAVRTAHLVVTLVSGSLLGLGLLGINGSGVRGDLLLSRVLAIQAGLGCAVAPWVIFRMMGRDRETVTAQLVAAGGLSPSRAVVVKLLAATSYVVQLLILSLPVASIGYLMGSGTPGSLLWGYLELLPLLFVAQLATVCWSLLHDNAGRALGLAYGTVLLVVLLQGISVEAGGRAAGLATLLLLGLVMALVSWRAAGPRLLYRRA